MLLVCGRAKREKAEALALKAISLRVWRLCRAEIGVAAANVNRLCRQYQSRAGAQRQPASCGNGGMKALLCGGAIVYREAKRELSQRLRQWRRPMWRGGKRR